MRLYGYIASKEELLDLMLDAVQAVIQPSGDTPRDVLWSLAENTRQAAFGPYLERTFATGRLPALERSVREGGRLEGRPEIPGVRSAPWTTPTSDAAVCR